MPLLPTTSVSKNAKYFRITPDYLKTLDPKYHPNVVDGEGSRRSKTGSRYSAPAQETVYLAEDFETCLSEKMFYFLRNFLEAMDKAQAQKIYLPPQLFLRRYVLWEIQFASEVPKVLDLTIDAHQYAADIIPSFLRNPFRDYEHLVERRAFLQSEGYDGLRVPSARCPKNGAIIVLFREQSRNVATITPHDISFHLITRPSGSGPSQPFQNRLMYLMGFGAC